MIARVHFAVDPTLPANRAIADLALAPRNASGKVEFSGDLLFFLPKASRSARGTVFLEVVNRGRDQSLGLMSGARQRDLAPETWNLGDRFLLEQGFTVAFLGWQFDVTPGEGLGLDAPTAPVDRRRPRQRRHRERGGPNGAIGLAYCAADPAQPDAALTFRSTIDGPAQVLPRDELAVRAGRMLGAAAGAASRPACTRRSTGRPGHRWPALDWRPCATSRRT